MPLDTCGYASHTVCNMYSAAGLKPLPMRSCINSSKSDGGCGAALPSSASPPPPSPPTACVCSKNSITSSWRRNDDAQAATRGFFWWGAVDCHGHAVAVTPQFRTCRAKDRLRSPPHHSKPRTRRLSSTTRTAMFRSTKHAAKALQRQFSTKLGPRDPVIVSYARTPIATFNGSFAGLSGPELGAIANKAAVERAGLQPNQIQEAYLGNVVSAGIGQAPARQSVLKAGFPDMIPFTTVNKVCASGMKAVAMAAQSIMAGSQDIMLAGGFESMSNVPYYLPKARTGYRLGDGKLVDGVIHDGLWDPYNNQHMGICGEVCAEDFGFSREDQDAYAIESYVRAQKANERGFFKTEITPVEVKQRRGDPKVFTSDEEPFNTKTEKIPSLRPAFKKDGTVTAANASPLNDGAAALVVMSYAKAQELGLKPMARIRGFADAAQKPVEFTIAPSKAVPLALHHAGLQLSDVDYHEINEAFSVVALANMRLMNIAHDRINVNGGAVAIGHPIGMSGARIVGTLIHVLRERDATIGAASICNGGGGAGAMIIERLE
ncbi:TPA: hypothetical protein N0F65_000620 [Lagenidium giganteum]|uniref:acetyl-CoA C-acetyltransferase n=1 Tax=Lagenidium giganteum TaxID=4803 RepID=A0AAV2YNR7_9STRA|nr:TPA: hypothetical protein N0F65_000620 [Lagenidium giganteum]